MWSRILLLATTAGVPVLCQAAESCPWLTTATAGGVLGGVAAVTVSLGEAVSPSSRTSNSISSAGPTSASAPASHYSGNAVDDSDCTFSRLVGPGNAELHIEVRTMADPTKEFAPQLARCSPQSTPLKAIGSEAVACSVNDKPGLFLEQVVGRVRDRFFVIRLSMNTASVTRDVLGEKARKVAEHVAGNLF